MNAVTEVLQAAKAKIGTPKTWCKSGFFAENVHGEVTNPWAPDACKWCAYGAIQALRPPRIFGDRAEQFLLRALLVERGHTRVAHYNDLKRTSHKAMMRLFDKAIELSRAEGT